MKRMYPDDGGLKQQVKPFDHTFSGYSLLREVFGTERFKRAQLELPLDMHS
jgi:hypothetical protein